MKMSRRRLLATAACSVASVLKFQSEGSAQMTNAPQCEDVKMQLRSSLADWLSSFEKKLTNPIELLHPSEEVADLSVTVPNLAIMGKEHYDTDAFDACRCGNLHGTGDQHDIRAGFAGCGRNGIPHLP